jgi:hypothetical protein
VRATDRRRLLASLAPGGGGDVAQLGHRRYDVGQGQPGLHERDVGPPDVAQSADPGITCTEAEVFS